MQEQAGELVDFLRAEGFEASVCPAIKIVPPDSFDLMDDAIQRISTFDVIVFTSANSVESIVGRMRTLGMLLPADVPPVAAVGPSTARVASENGFNVAFLPKEFVAEQLASEMLSLEPGKVVLFRADIGRAVMRDALAAAGWDVSDIVAYRTVPGDGVRELAARLRAKSVEGVTFSSSSGVRYCVEGLTLSGDLPLLTQNGARPAVFCLGPVTAHTARTLGLQVDAVAETFDSLGLGAAIKQWFTNVHPND